MSEEFNTASRSVKPGLIACGVVSAWTWAATLLQSGSVTYDYGVAGPFWYAAGATVQIFMFSVLACKVKQNAPRCHTFLEIIYYRYGTVTHLIFIFFALMTNILVASQLLLGGSAVVTALTGMNVYAAVFLIPTGVCVYVVLGGLRATFLCDYTHTVIVMIIILYFMFDVRKTFVVPKSVPLLTRSRFTVRMNSLGLLAKCTICSFMPQRFAQSQATQKVLT